MYYLEVSGKYPSPKTITMKDFKFRSQKRFVYMKMKDPKDLKRRCFYSIIPYQDDFTIIWKPVN